jgi:hypothetical protein
VYKKYLVGDAQYCVNLTSTKQNPIPPYSIFYNKPVCYRELVRYKFGDVVIVNTPRDSTLTSDSPRAVHGLIVGRDHNSRTGVLVYTVNNTLVRRDYFIPVTSIYEVVRLTGVNEGCMNPLGFDKILGTYTSNWSYMNDIVNSGDAPTPSNTSTTSSTVVPSPAVEIINEDNGTNENTTSDDIGATISGEHDITDEVNFPKNIILLTILVMES